MTVKATATTGLAEADVFYFGNAVGESCNSASEAKVNAFDMLGARDNQRNFLDPAPIDFAYDFNRDARVNSIDMLIARNNQTHFLNALRLITVPGDKTHGDAILEQGGSPESERAEVLSAGLHALREYDQTAEKARHVDGWLSRAILLTDLR